MDFMDFYYANDRRTHRRFAVAMSARLYHANGHFSLCTTVDLSLTGASVQLDGTTPEPVTAFGCDETGKLAVTRFRFAKPCVRLLFDTSTQTRAVIGRALRALGDRQLLQPLPLRRGERLATRNTVLTRADGTSLTCNILDMSPNGMLLGSDTSPPPLGERVTLGKVTGIVVRHHRDSFAIRALTTTAGGKVVRLPYRATAHTSSPSFDSIA